MIGIYLIPKQGLWFWIVGFVSAFILSMVFATIFSKKRTFFYFVATIFLSIVFTIILTDTLISSIITFILLSLVSYRGVLYTERKWNELLPVSYIWGFGFPLYFIGYFFFKYVETLSPYLSFILWTGMIMVISSLFIINREHIKTATLSKEDNPSINPGITRQNHLYIVFTLFIIFAITNIQFFLETILTIIKAVIRGVIWLITLFDRDTPSSDELGNQEMEPFIPPVEETEPSLIALILEKIVQILFYLICVVAVVFILFYLYKKLKILFTYLYGVLIRFFKQMFSQISEQKTTHSYIDEKENVFDWKKWNQQKSNQVKQLITKLFMSRITWEKLSSIEKARYLYRNLIIRRVNKGYQAKHYYTPSETLREIAPLMNGKDAIHQLQDVYCQARYGQKELNERELDHLYRVLEEKHKQG